MQHFWLAGWLLILGASACRTGPTPDLASRQAIVDAMRAHTHELRFEKGRLVGPGADLLWRAAKGARFFALGEPHNMKQVPEITSALFAELQARYGYEYLALEAGPVATAMVTSPGARGNRARVNAFAQRYPNAFAFSSDQEIDMLADIGARSRGKTPAVWGVDQAFGALHLLDRLIELAPGEAARTATQRLRDAAEPLDGRRLPNEAEHYMARLADPHVFVELRRVYGAAPGSEAASLLDTLVKSRRIYHNDWRASRGEPTGYLSAHEREQNMKELFLQAYRRAENADARAPHVLLKAGHVHLRRGRNKSRVHSLGNLVSEFATILGTRSFHLNVAAINEPGQYWTLDDFPTYAPLAEAGDPGKWVIVDLRALRGHVGAWSKAGAGRDFVEMILSWDAALLVGGASAATFEVVPR